MIEEIRNFCKKHDKKFYLSNNVLLAKNLGLDGVYIPSFNTLLNTSWPNVNKKFLKIGSAHSVKEIKIKEKQGVKLLFNSLIRYLSNLFINVKNLGKLLCMIVLVV